MSKKAKETGEPKVASKLQVDADALHAMLRKEITKEALARVAALVDDMLLSVSQQRHEAHDLEIAIFKVTKVEDSTIPNLKFVTMETEDDGRSGKIRACLDENQEGTIELGATYMAHMVKVTKKVKTDAE